MAKPAVTLVSGMAGFRERCDQDPSFASVLGALVSFPNNFSPHSPLVTARVSQDYNILISPGRGEMNGVSLFSDTPKDHALVFYCSNSMLYSCVSR